MGTWTPFFNISGHDPGERKEEEEEEEELLMGIEWTWEEATGESGSSGQPSAAWQSICTIIHPFYMNSTCMHHTTLHSQWRSHHLKMTLYKRRYFFFSVRVFCFFLETNLYTWTLFLSSRTLLSPWCSVAATTYWTQRSVLRSRLRIPSPRPLVIQVAQCHYQNFLQIL